MRYVQAGTVTRNVFTIYTADSGTAPSRNTAVKSRSWAHVCAPATDLGGNKASGNGRSPRRVRVAC